jgi:valyl-tRNA synthetase
MLAPYPEVDESAVNPDAEKEMDWIQTFILGIRKIRGEYNISPGKPLTVSLQNGNQHDQELLQKHQTSLEKLCKTDAIVWLEEDEGNDEAARSATALVGQMRLLIPMAGLIDKQAEIDRLNKLLDKESKELQRISAKLNNQSFVDKAPENVVNAEKDKAQRAEVSIQQLKQQLEKIQAL